MKRASLFSYGAKRLFWQQRGFTRQQSTRCRNPTLPPGGSNRPASPGHERKPATVDIMSAGEFHGRLTRSSAGRFNPGVAPFTPEPDVAVPPSSWQPQPGQVFRGGHVPAGRRDSLGHAARGMHGNYPVSHGARPGQPSSAGAGTPQPDLALPKRPDQSSVPSVGGLQPGQANMTQTPGLGNSIAPRSPAGSGAGKKKKGEKKKYQVPSAASGGVPNPTKLYITQSAQLPSVLPYPRRILVVIDLNGTLLHRPNHRNSARFVERPFARTFLDYCLQTFVVAIWSSAKPENVQRMVPQLLSPEDQSRLVAVWGRDTLGLSPADYNNRVQVYKRLDTVWSNQRVAASHPEAHLGMCWDQTNTVLIDDSREKGRSEPYNLIQLPEFTGNADEVGYVLPQVHDYLNQCSQQRDVSSFIRENPFVFNEKFSLDI